MGLVTTSDGAQLNEAAAADYELLNAAFRAAFGKDLSISSGARTRAQQVKAFTDNHQLTPILNNGRYITRKWNGLTWYLKPGKATVAVPGTSDHEYPPGRAADFGSGVQTRGSREHNWMLANAGRFNWEWTGEHFVTIEPWHWAHTSGSSSGGGDTSEGFLMALDNDQQVELLNGVSAIYAAIFGENGKLGSLPRATNLPTQIETIRQAVASLQIGQANANAYLYAGGPGVDRTEGAPNSIFGLLLHATGGQTVDVDEAELAAQLAPLITAGLGRMTDEDVQRIAKEAADEQDRRERKRLGT